jgi:hypothetical protein
VVLKSFLEACYEQRTVVSLQGHLIYKGRPWRPTTQPPSTVPCLPASPASPASPAASPTPAREFAREFKPLPRPATTSTSPSVAHAAAGVRASHRSPIERSKPPQAAASPDAITHVSSCSEGSSDDESDEHDALPILEQMRRRCVCVCVFSRASPPGPLSISCGSCAG